VVVTQPLDFCRLHVNINANSTTHFIFLLLHNKVSISCKIDMCVSYKDEGNMGCVSYNDEGNMGCVSYNDEGNMGCVSYKDEGSMGYLFCMICHKIDRGGSNCKVTEMYDYQTFLIN
jgi:hypothetical protein